MDRNLARLVVASGLRSARELNELLFVVKEHYPPDEYELARSRLANAIAEINKATLSPAFEAHPDLEAEVAAQIEKFGRFA